MTVENLPLDSLAPHPAIADTDAMEEDALTIPLMRLVASIKEEGLIHPISVLPADEEGKFHIIAGARRWRAYLVLRKQYGEDFSTIPSVVLPGDLQSEAKKRIHENRYRQSFTNIEYIESFLALLPIIFGQDTGNEMENRNIGIDALRYFASMKKAIARGGDPSISIKNIEKLFGEGSVSRIEELFHSSPLSFSRMQSYIPIISGDERILSLYKEGYCSLEIAKALLKKEEKEIGEFDRTVRKNCADADSRRECGEKIFSQLFKERQDPDQRFTGNLKRLRRLFRTLPHGAEEEANRAIEKLIEELAKKIKKSKRSRR
jgi:hypothetical protein